MTSVVKCRYFTQEKGVFVKMFHEETITMRVVRTTLMPSLCFYRVRYQVPEGAINKLRAFLQELNI